ncbi:MAG: CHAT domain-containing protein [Gemmatimonadales bacterium]|nr:CHAT domain-containing protein [Gemmatimonadales bacterium]
MNFKQLLVSALCFLFLSSFSACGDQSKSLFTDLQLLAPFLSEAESRALSDSDPDVFHALAEHLGSDRLIQISSEFLGLVFADSAIATENRKALLSFYQRVTSTLADFNYCPEFQAELDFFMGLEPAEAQRIIQTAQEQEEVFASPDYTPGERLERMIEIHDELVASGYALAVSESWENRGTLATRVGQPELAREMYTSRLAHARQWKLRTSRCGALASLIMQGFLEGNTDSTGVLLERGLALARESRLGAQTGRLLALTGYLEFSLGHYSSAVRFFEDGIAACRNYGSPAKGLAYLGTLMRMYAVMESWALVDQISLRAEILMTEAQETESSEFSTNLQFIRLEEIKARSLMARGQVDEAHAAYDFLWDQILTQPFEEASFFANFWIMGLLDHHRPELAADALSRAEPYARDAGIRHMLVRLPFWKARTCFQQGRIDSAVVHLDRFAAEGLGLVQWTPDLQIPYFALRVRLLAETDPQSAAETLTKGLVALGARLTDNDAGAGAFLDLSRARGLRWASHDLFGSDPGVGYGLELMWRRYLGVMGEQTEKTSAPFTSSDPSIVAEARLITARAMDRLDRSKAVHLLFQVREPWVVRWTVGNGTVKRDTLSNSVSDLRKSVGVALRAMSTDPGDPDAVIEPRLTALLGELAHQLLPDFLLDSHSQEKPSLLFISGESFLSQIPFAPLNVGREQEYVPLAARVDLSWVRNPDVPPVPVPGEVGLLIASPNIDPVLTRRYRSLGSLAGAGPEIAAVQNIYPGELLTGPNATKNAVTSSWSKASLIYFLGHVIHNPEVPFLTTIPLTPPNGPHLPNEAALDIANIRTADLSRCRLAVLSGCGSGAPFADGVITAPSLGDAFLDAGAGAALLTFWRIRDENPLFQPEEVVQLWKEEGLSLPEALSEVRRDALNGPNGIRHPFGWGAWSLKVGGLSD